MAQNEHEDETSLQEKIVYMYGEATPLGTDAGPPQWE